MTKQNLFTEEELTKVTDEAERKHLIECAQDQSKIDMKYMEIMSKYDLWEKGKRSRCFHATTHENAKKIMQDGVIRKGMDGGVYICKQPLEAARKGNSYKRLRIHNHDKAGQNTSASH